MYSSLPLTMTTPVIVELNQPQGVAVVEVVHVVIVDVDHIRVLIQSDKAGAECVLHPEATGEVAEAAQKYYAQT